MGSMLLQRKRGRVDPAKDPAAERNHDSAGGRPLKYAIICEKPDLIEGGRGDGDMIVLSPEEYIDNRGRVDFRKNSRLKIINLCGNYEYLSKGYYCSLLAEARGQRCVPPVSAVISMNWKRLTQNSMPELNALLSKYYKVPQGNEISKTFVFYFGRAEDPMLEPLSRRIFDIFRFPLVSVEIKYEDDHWAIGDIEALAVDDLSKQKIAVFNDSLSHYTGKSWNEPKKPAQEKFWLGILHDPNEKFPPSDKAALECFVKAGKRQNVYVELITRDDMASLLEYDALFIRETTAIDHHTYRFAHKAQAEGIPCIDDPDSIIRCSNKVFLNELLASKNIRMPRTHVVDRAKARTIEKDLEFPVIIKVPDGSFSRGVVKVSGVEEYRKALAGFFKDSDILLVQDYVPSDYDWRIGVLGGEPLYACQYFMAKGHWQIYNHANKGSAQSGNWKTYAIEDVPEDVVKAAVGACKLIGNGLYGVDLKEREDGIYIIEVNDNPNIDKGVEDAVLGDKLYDRIISHFAALVAG